MNVLFTLAILAVLALWGLAIYRRLLRLRRQILLEWKQLEAREKAGDPAADGKRYNELAVAYNTTLAGFPENIIAGFAGFRPAQMFVRTKP